MASFRCVSGYDQLIVLSSEGAQDQAQPSPGLNQLVERGLSRRTVKLEAIVLATQCAYSQNRGFNISVVHIMRVFASSQIKTSHWSVDIRDRPKRDACATWPNQAAVDENICRHVSCEPGAYPLLFMNPHDESFPLEDRASFCPCDQPWADLPDRGHWLAVDPFAVPGVSPVLDKNLSDSLMRMTSVHEVELVTMQWAVKLGHGLLRALVADKTCTLLPGLHVIRMLAPDDQVTLDIGKGLWWSELADVLKTRRGRGLQAEFAGDFRACGSNDEHK